MRKFELREIIFISLIVAAILTIGYALLPFMQMLPTPAFRALLVAPIYSTGVTLLASRIRRPGTITMMGLLIGSLLSIFFIWMFFIAVIGGVLTDLTCFILFKGYDKDKSIAIAAGLFPAYQLPSTFVVVAYTLGGVTKGLLNNSLVILVPTIVTFILGYLTSKGLQKILRSRSFESM